MHAHDQERALTAEDVAERLRMHPATVRRLAALGELPPPRRIRGSVRWLDSEITSWLRERPVRGAQT
jgi:predicted DNA-binding transcriptional regulator AlpA